MNAPSVLHVLRWSVWETLRQSLASRVFWLMLAVSGLSILFCLGIGVRDETTKLPDDIELYDANNQPLTGPSPTPGELTVAFGAVRVPLFRDGPAGVRFVQALLAKWVAGGAGLLLALVCTAGFVPEFVHPGTAAVLLAKPVPRWCLLLGKYAGVVLFVALQGTVFFVGTWVALGVRTGCWDAGYLWGVPILVLHFGLVYTIPVQLAVATRSTAVSLLGGVLFWLICFGVNFARHAAAVRTVLDPRAAPYPPSFRGLIDLCYWLLPKPVDMLALLERAVGTTDHFASSPVLDAAVGAGEFVPELSLLSGVAFAAAMLAIAAHSLATADYG
jgi:ABC-type transport system involved in multi-copper enzyme maturation permease subunit